MGKGLLTLLLIMVEIIYATCQTDHVKDENANISFSNPVWDGADPWMVKHGDDYISCFKLNNSIVVCKSKRMTIRGELKSIWSAPSTGWNRACV